MDYIAIDGSEGEGGGQIIRTSLSLSMLTGKPFRMYNIRARRPNPGLQAQHLTGVYAARDIAQARVDGARKGSDYLVFEPMETSPGFYSYDIKTAGSTSLILQTVYLPLALSDDSSFLKIKGGTHVAWAPTADYMVECWRSFLSRIGIAVDFEVIDAGFYPVGGGGLTTVIIPSTGIKPLRLVERGMLKRTKCKITISRLPGMIADRIEKRCGALLRASGIDPEFEVYEADSVSTGVALAVVGEFEETRCCYTALGERGKRSETVAEEGCRRFLAFLDKGAALDQYMADQILLPLTRAEGDSEFTTSEITQYLLTNIRTIEKFSDIRIEVEAAPGEEGRIIIKR